MVVIGEGSVEGELAARVKEIAGDEGVYGAIDAIGGSFTVQASGWVQVLQWGSSAALQGQCAKSCKLNVVGNGTSLASAACVCSLPQLIFHSSVARGMHQSRNAAILCLAFLVCRW